MLYCHDVDGTVCVVLHLAGRAESGLPGDTLRAFDAIAAWPTRRRDLAPRQPGSPGLSRRGDTAPPAPPRPTVV